jgi:hypothetical protein
MLLEVFTSLLLASAAEDRASPLPTAERPADRKICRKQIETGSLIKGKKVCFTAAQWQKMADAARDNLERSATMGSASGK